MADSRIKLDEKRNYEKNTKYTSWRRSNSYRSTDLVFCCLVAATDIRLGYDRIDHNLLL